MGIYLDNNATTRVDPELVEAMLPYFTEEFGNPSSMHTPGGKAQDAVRQARAQVQKLVGAAEPQEIIFTSGGTESVNTAILSGIATASERWEIVTSAVEHPAVLTLCRWLEENEGIRVHVVPVDASGQLDMTAYEAALSERVAIVSIMWANNETGVVFPVAELARKAKAVGALYHTDAVQAAGKLRIDVKSAGVDMLSLSGHKLHAPKGIGALFVKRGIRFTPQFHGGRQERGRRPGTENVPGIVGLGKAAELAVSRLHDETTRVRGLRDRLEKGLLSRIDRCFAVGGESERVANTTNIAFHDVAGEDAVLLLDKAGVAASLGSACAAGSFEPSHVLKAMQVPESAVHGGIRFSLSRFTTDADIDRALEIVPTVIGKLRASAIEEGARPALGVAHA